MAKANKLILVVDGTAGALYELIDSRIDINNPTNEDLLMYNSLSGKFEANSIGAVVAEVALTGDYNDLFNKPVLVCNYDTLNNTMDKTPAEIVAAKTENKIVICKLSYPTTDFLFLNQANSNPFVVFTGLSQTTSSTSVLTAKYHVLRYTTTDGWKFFTFDIQQRLVVDTEISETSTNPVQNKAIGIELRKLWNKKEIVGRIDNEYPKKNGYLNSSGTWTNSTTIKHCIIPCNDIKEFTITSDPNVSSYYTFLKTYTEGTPPSSTYAEGYSGRKDYRLGTHTYKVPKDAQYLYLGFGSTPVSLLFTGIGITDEFELPSLDNNAGKVLAVNSTETDVEWIKPVTIYSGTSAPSNSIGADGDIYIQTT